MEFAGDKYIYLSKLKKEKIRKIRESEKENKDAPIPISKVEDPKDDISKKLNQYNQGKIQKPGGSIVSDDSDDAYLEVNSKNFNIDLINSSHPNIQSNQQGFSITRFLIYLCLMKQIGDKPRPIINSYILSQGEKLVFFGRVNY